MTQEPSLFDDQLGESVGATDLLEPESLLSLMALPGVGSARAIKVAEVFRSWDALLDASPDARRAIARVFIDLSSRPQAVEPPDNVQLVGWFDKQYPTSLRTISNAPAVLWLRGNLPDPARRLAIVGSRSASAWGASASAYFASSAAAEGISVVSGLALGIDIAAHRAALDAGGQTVAVLGSGVDVPSPREHLADVERILAEGGALISEQPLGTPPSARTLVARNRIQSGLSGATVVVQCPPKSGTMSTAKFTVEQGRVLAVPVPTDPDERAAEVNSGSLSLTREFGGAALALRGAADLATLLSGIRE